MASMGSLQQDEFRTGWRILLAAILGTALGFPTLGVHTLGVFAPALSRAFGWSYSSIMAGLIIVTASMFVTGPFAGWLCDRYGVRLVATLSSVLLGLGFMAFGALQAHVAGYYAVWLLLSLVGAGSAQLSWTRAINQHFDRHRGLALGIALSGVGVFAFCGRLIANWLVASLGWRAAYLGIGLLPITVLAPVAWWGLRGLPASSAPSTITHVHKWSGIGLRDAIRRRHFWFLGLAFLLMSIAIGGPIPNMENVLVAHHFTRADAAEIVPWLGITLIAGRLLGGWLADFVWAPLVASILLGLTAAACLALFEPNISRTVALAAVLLLGGAIGCEIDLASYMVARYFGMRHYGLVYGVLYAPIAFGGGVGPTLFAKTYDMTGSYGVAFLAASIGLVCAAALFLSLGRYPVAHEMTVPGSAGRS